MITWFLAEAVPDNGVIEFLRTLWINQLFSEVYPDGHSAAAAVATSPMTGVMTALAFMVSIGLLATTVYLIFRKLWSADGHYVSWGAVIFTALGTGISVYFIGLVREGWNPVEDLREAIKGLGSDDEPTPSPSTPTPSSDSPISIPEVENPGAIWNWLGIATFSLVLLVIAYLFVQKIRRDRVRKIELENKRLEAEAEARRLAEEESRRQQMIAERRARLDARWGTITDLHAQLKQRVVDAETDWDTLFSLPALTDVSFRQTRALHRAMREAENAVIPMPANFDERTVMSKIPYVKKVHAFEDAWKIALANAQKVGTTKLPAAEIRMIKRIRVLLTLAEGSGNDFERASAYEQIRKLLGELRVVQLPARAVAAIESRTVLAITAGPEAASEPISSVPRPVRAR